MLKDLKPQIITNKMGISYPESKHNIVINDSCKVCIAFRKRRRMHNVSNVNDFLLHNLEVKHVNGQELFIKIDDHKYMRLGFANWAEINTEFKMPPVTKNAMKT